MCRLFSDTREDDIKIMTSLFCYRVMSARGNGNLAFYMLDTWWGGPKKLNKHLMEYDVSELQQKGCAMWNNDGDEYFRLTGEITIILEESLTCEHKHAVSKLTSRCWGGRFYKTLTGQSSHSVLLRSSSVHYKQQFVRVKLPWSGDFLFRILFQQVLRIVQIDIQ